MAERAALLDEIALHVADGTPVDWDEAERTAANDEERETLGELRLVAAVSAVSDDPDAAVDPSSASDPSSAPGTTVGRYRLVSKLGEGGMGSVWRAEDTRLGRNVALKLLSDRLADSTQARKRFLREAKAACSLDHHGIATVYDAGEDGDRIWIAFRLIDGETVAARIARDGPLPLAEALRIAASAADALGHAHDRGVLHRDVSARNLMLDRDGKVVIIDFGLALPEDTTRVTRSGTTLGTAAYIAPEVIRGEPADARADIYGLGAVLYEMLTGSPPFTGDRLETLLYAAVHEDPAPPSRRRLEVPSELDCVMLRALAKEPAQRFDSMKHYFAALRECQTGPLPETITISVPRPPPRWRRFLVASARRVRRLRPRQLAVAAAILALVGAAAWVVRDRVTGPPPPSRIGSVAVLPLRNLSSDPTTGAHIADGLGEALATKLTKAGVRVTPWTISRRHTDTEAAVEEIVRRLNVDAVLVGTFSSQSERIRGSVSLVDGRSGFQVWADEFDEPLANLFAVQNRIAMGAASKFVGELTSEQVDVLAKPLAGNVEAYDLYLQGQAAALREDPASAEAALALFDRAIEVDPSFPLAEVGLGTVRYNQYFFAWDGGPEKLAEAEAHFQKALRLDPTSIAARRGLMRVYWELGHSEEVLRQGKRSADNGGEATEALLARAESYMLGGLPRKALPLFRSILERDPENVVASWHLVIAGVWAGSHDEAARDGRAHLEHFGDDYEVHLWTAAAEWSMGNLREAGAHFESFLEQAPEGRGATGWMASFLRHTGQSDRADRLLLDHVDRLEELAQRTPDNPRLRLDLARTYAVLGDLDRLREEETRLRRLSPNNGYVLMELATTHAEIGENDRSLALVREALAAGFCEFLWSLRVGFKDPDVESWAGFGETFREYETLRKRLEALY